MGRYKYNRGSKLTDSEELQELVEKARWTWLKSLVVFLYLFGCRPGEAKTVERKDIRLTEDRIYATLILHKRGPRGPYDAPAHVLMISRKSPLAEEILIPYFEGVKAGYLWPQSRSLVWLRLKELSPNISGYVFRHDRLSKLAIAGASPFQVKQWAGWSDLRPWKNYEHLSSKEIEPLAELVD